MYGHGSSCPTDLCVIAEPLGHNKCALKHGVSCRVEPSRAKGKAPEIQHTGAWYAVAAAQNRQPPLAQLQQLREAEAPGEMMADVTVGLSGRFGVPQPLVCAGCLTPVRQRLVPTVKAAQGQTTLVEQLCTRCSVFRWVATRMRDRNPAVPWRKPLRELPGHRPAS